MSRRPKLKISRFDRALAWVAPRLALNRIGNRAAFALVSGYIGGARDRNATSQWTTLAASADSDTLPDLDVLRARSRDLIRNDPLAQSAVATKAVNVVGTGHVVRPEIDAARLGLSDSAKEAWEKEALAVWREWSESPDCDITRTSTFVELEDLVYRSRLASGDVFAVHRFRERPGRLLGAAVQIVEADRVSNPNWQRDTDKVAGGVEFDHDGAPVAYHFADRHAIDLRKMGAGVNWTRVPAFSASGRRLVLHIHGARTRPDMTRYAPMLAPVIESLKQRSRYSEAELMAAVVSACFAIGTKSPEGDLSTALETGQNASSDQAEIKITEPGKIFDLLPNEEIQSFAPGRPNPQFSPFIDALAQEIGAGIDLPYELLLKRFQASYSASRAALEMAWQFFRVDRAHHVAQFCKPVYEEVISEAVERGILRAPGFLASPLVRRAWLGAVWMGPARPTLDPSKDAAGDKAYYELGVTSRTRIAAERFGVDIREVDARRRQEGPADGGDAAAVQAPDEADDDGDNDEETS